MKRFILMSLFVSTSAFANVSDFAGSYEVVSGEDGTIGCTNFDIVVDVLETRMQIYTSEPKTLIEEFKAINGGVVGWEEDLGDVIVKGKSKTTYDGIDQVKHEVRTFFSLKLYKKVVLTLKGDLLRIQRKYDNQSKLCVLKKKSF